MKVDWTHPIETVPCERNPEPAPCRVVSGPDKYGRYRVALMGKWIDSDRRNECGEVRACEPDGRFWSLNGSVRNVATAEAATTPTCTMCDGTGSKDHAGFAMDPCDHKPAAVDAPKTLRDEFAMAALTGLLADNENRVRFAQVAMRTKANERQVAVSVAYDFADAMMAERRKGAV